LPLNGTYNKSERPERKHNFSKNYSTLDLRDRGLLSQKPIITCIEGKHLKVRGKCAPAKKLYFNTKENPSIKTGYKTTQLKQQKSGIKTVNFSQSAFSTTFQANEISDSKEPQRQSRVKIVVAPEQRLDFKRTT